MPTKTPASKVKKTPVVKARDWRDVNPIDEKPKSVSKTKVVEEEKKRPKRVSRTKEVEEEESIVVFNPLANIDEQLDLIEKSYALTGSSMLLGEKRQTTGLLGLDLVMGGGIIPGWYTTFGPEQSCKSTLTMWMMLASIDSGIPILSVFDYEGCLTGSTLIETSKGRVPISSLFLDREVTQDVWISLTKGEVEVKTAGGSFTDVSGICCKGIKPTTYITLEDGKILSGYKHPVLVLTNSGDLDWKFIEDLKEGDFVVTENSDN